MKNFITYVFISIFSAIILYFLSLIFLRGYFNTELYKTPNFIGMTLQEGEKVIKGHPFKLIVIGEEPSDAPINTIFFQEPSPNHVVKKGRNIRVVISKGSEKKLLPNVIGLSLNDGKAIIQSQGFKLGSVAYVTSNLSEGTILASSPPSRTMAPRDKPVSLLVSSKTANTIIRMPDLLGLSLDDASYLLRNNNLVLGSVTYQKIANIEPGIVIRSSVDFNNIVQVGTVVNITLSQDIN